MSLPAQRPATYADLCALPDNVVGELINGALHAAPRPVPRHGRVTSMIGVDLTGPFDRGRGGPGGWIIFDEPEIHLSGDVLVSDIAGWRRERMAELPEEAFFSQAPDWICEVLSPSTAMLDRTVKMDIYAREGVRYLWLIDPTYRLLETYRLRDGRWVVAGVYGDDAVVRAEPFDAIELELRYWWSLAPAPQGEE